MVRPMNQWLNDLTESMAEPSFKTMLNGAAEPFSPKGFGFDVSPSTFWFYIVMIINFFVLKICFVKSCSFVFGLILFWTRNTHVLFSC